MKNNIQKKDGEVVNYYDNGQISWKCNKKNGKTEGQMIGYYKNGLIHYINNYVEGKMDGVQLDYNSYGSVESIGEFKNGILSGDIITYEYYNIFPQIIKLKRILNSKHITFDIEEHIHKNIFDKILHKESLKLGIYIWYNENGNIEKEEEYIFYNKLV